MQTGLTPALLERLLLEGKLSRRQFIGGLISCGLSAGAVEALVGCDSTGLSAGSDPGRYLCLIVLDGFRPDYLQLAAMPAFAALARSGMTYSRAWVGQLESQTPVGHATISTGVFPRHHGVIGFEWRDPATRLEVLDGWEQGSMLGQVGRDLHAHTTASIPQAIKKADPSAVVATLSSEKVYAADAMGVEAADYVLYHRIAHNRLLPAGLPGQLPPADFFAGQNLSLPLPLQHFTDWDDLSLRLALTAFGHYRPTALMVNLPGSDVYGHKFGARTAPAIMAQVVAGQDRAIGRIVEAYRSAGIFNRTLFVITADHGMVPNDRAVGPSQIGGAINRAGAQSLFHTGGTAKYVYLRDQSRSLVRPVARELARIPGVTGSYVRLSNGEYDRAAGSLDPALDAAYRYLLTTFSGVTGPDVVAPYRENTVGTTLPVAYGNHGGLSWGAQHVPLVLSGPGVRRGARSTAPARLVDLAPTILRLLGLPPTPADGVVLADALQNPTAHEIAAQAGLEPLLRQHQEALVEQAGADEREDRTLGLHPPPLPPAKP